MSAAKPLPTGGFSYTPLSKASNIRLVIIKGGQESDNIICTLFETSLEDEDKPYYEAISYVWGDPTKTHHVICDGLYLGITANLHAALRAFRELEEPRALWADAICIDQANLEERSSQVALMKNVYKEAWRVLIWLGDRNVHDDEACAMINVLASSFDNQEAPPLVDQHYWSCLRVFFQRPWFSRTWIVQEAGSAREGMVVWGRLCVDLEELLKVEGKYALDFY